MKAKELRDLSDAELAKHVAKLAQGPVRAALPERDRRAREHRRPRAAKRDLARALTIARERGR